MINRVAHFTGKQEQDALDNVIQCHPSQHGAVKQRWKVMMKIQHARHRPERRVMEDPSDEKPYAGVLYFTSLLEHDNVVDASPLLAHGSVDIKNHIYHKEDYVPPPNHRIAEQIYSLIVSGEELPLRMRGRALSIRHTRAIYLYIAGERNNVMIYPVIYRPLPRSRRHFSFFDL